MQLENTRIILTGAAGGIGREIARRLIEKGAHVALLDRNAAVLEEMAGELGDTAWAVSADLLDGPSRNKAVEQAKSLLGGVDMLINNAGLMSFKAYAEEDPVLLERILQLNTLTPMLITHQLLPDLQAQGRGQIVNIGSTFGTIGFAFFTAYSASKFGLRGFSEALRRELDGSGVGVTYIAPRAVKTPLNTGSIYRMAEAVKMNMDEADRVADQVILAIESDEKDKYLGFPEKLFARINALMPRLVDGALRKQNQQMAPFAKETS